MSQQIIQHIQPKHRMSRAVIHQGVIYFAGIVADSTDDDIHDQTKNILHKIESVLEEVGSDRSKLLSVTIYLRDMADFESMNAIWDAWVIPGQAPARATVQAALANPKYLIEISVVAAK
jgi:enamine deaminase RidA (YjgF/YER057c/UK114 family)